MILFRLLNLAIFLALTRFFVKLPFYTELSIDRPFHIELFQYSSIKSRQIIDVDFEIHSNKGSKKISVDSKIKK